MALVKDLAKSVNTYLKRSGISPSTFGRMVLNDPRFCSRIKVKDADLKASTVDRVQAYLDKENKKLDRAEARKPA